MLDLGWQHHGDVVIRYNILPSLSPDLCCETMFIEWRGIAIGYLVLKILSVYLVQSFGSPDNMGQ